MTRTSSQQAASALLFLMAIAVSGCGQSHDHDHDHAAHVDPAHWPSDFPDAIGKLIKGHQDTLATRSDRQALLEILHIQRDLAKWLPEVAADSDMPEESWNQIQAVATTLLDSYQAALTQVEAGQSPAAGLLAAAQKNLETLTRIRDSADPNWFVLPGQTAESIQPATDATNSSIES